jgi:biotin carboxyl carrier protein
MKVRICINEETFEVEVGDLTSRPILATVEGEVIEVWPEEAAPQPAVVAIAAPAPVIARPTAAPVTPAADKTKAILAPIPGVILSISAGVGDTVAFGQEVCVLEAMKMKNVIRAGRAGKIAAVRVTPGDQVRHSQVLIEFAD